MVLEGYAAELEYQPELRAFRGVVVNLQKDALDFVGDSVESLEREFAESLRVYREGCRERGQEPETPGTVPDA